MKIKANLIVCTLGLFVYGCSSDDATPVKDPISDEVPTENEPTTSELQDKTVDFLTNNGDLKVWKVSSAIVTNGTESFDISDNFNVLDDEIVFSGNKENGSLEWRKGHDINLSAQNIEETLLDYYRSPKSSPFSFVGESDSTLTSDDFDIQISDESSVLLTLGSNATAKSKNITNKDLDVQVNFVLTPKVPNDYKFAPDDLVFSEAFTVETASVETHSPGMIGSNSDNSFFYVTREDGYTYGNPDNPQQIRPDRVVKFDLDDMSQTEFVDYENIGSATKQLHIINNELISIGGGSIRKYDFDLTNQVISDYNSGLISEEFGTEIVLSRFGMAVQDDYAYIIGGATTWFGDEWQGAIEETKNIYRLDLNNNSLTFFAQLPEPRFGARGTIVDNKMYVFGGSPEFGYLTPATDTIYIIDMNNPDSIQTLNLGSEIQHSFVQKDDNIIYVTGYKILDFTDQGLGNVTVNYDNTKIWAFDTEDNSLKELSHNLSNPNGGSAVHQMAIFNGKMFLLYGDRDESLANEDNFYWPLQEWKVYMADLE